MVKGWKAFRIDKEGRLRYLFHAHRPAGENKGSSLVEMDKWLECQRRWGREAQGKKYRVAFHFLRNQEDIAPFQKLTGHKYIIIPIVAHDVEPKPRTRVGSWLARKIYVDSAEARKAVSAAGLALSTE